ncbi:MAG TPA: carbamoyl-phosphate synthase small subunit [Phaeodactylibacter sp.]|nr:carbamoyl-phosphate synthase small subunit [Phaeodactylibacter sp.]
MQDYTPAILLLEDGTHFQAYGIGRKGTAVGEICFNTGMTGYQEVFTDPSYFGQILVMTQVHIGNYGALEEEMESEDIRIAGLVVRNFSDHFSRPLEGREKGPVSLSDWFEERGLTGIAGVDTRALVRHIRTKGAMNAIISSETTDLDELKKRLAQQPSMKGLELASQVSTSKPYFWGEETAPYRVAVADFGVKRNILRCLAERGCYLKVFPAETPLREMEEWSPDGYFLSNGPGDPAAMEYAVELTRGILALDKPLFGICLGHQILGLAVDLPTYKMHHGHRGINQPVKNRLRKHAEITSQNHGFGVSPEAVREKAEVVEITHVNLNDDTIEGYSIIGRPAFSVQFHPEAAPGPHDSRYLFDEFVELLKKSRS